MEEYLFMKFGKLPDLAILKYWQKWKKKWRKKKKETVVMHLRRKKHQVKVKRVSLRLVQIRKKKNEQAQNVMQS
jgi:hypothetical protein